MPLVKFNKPALDLAQQLQKWQIRGLGVGDSASAIHYLEFIGYYRFSGYALSFQDAGHADKHFKPGTRFEDLLSLYVFDRELRLLVMDAIERTESAIKARIVNEMSVKHGPHWFMDSKHFVLPPPPQLRPVKPYFSHNDLLDQIDGDLGIPKSAKLPCRPHNEVFINHYYKCYSDPYLPPAWMVFEILSMGTVSRLFAGLKEPNDRSAIASRFGVDEQVLQNWLHVISHIRNMCAHHRRLWNRQLVIKFIISKKLAYLVAHLPLKDRFYAIAVILHYFMGIVAPKSTWHCRLSDLINTCPLPPAGHMGFPNGWRSLPFWSIEPAAVDYSI